LRLQLIWEIALVVHQGVVVRIRKGEGCSWTTGRTALDYLGPLRNRDGRIQTGGRKPHTQKKVENQNRDEAP